MTRAPKTPRKKAAVTPPIPCTCPPISAPADDSQSYAAWESDLNTWLGFRSSDLYEVLSAAGFGDEFSVRLTERAKAHGAIKNRQALTDMLIVAQTIFSINGQAAGRSRCAAIAEAIQYGTDYPNLPVNPLDGLHKLSANTCEKHHYTTARAQDILSALDKRGRGKVYCATGCTKASQTIS
jgi:hypothetical protein